MRVLPVLIGLAFAMPLWAQTPDFGTDSSDWAKDGECDDPRFIGPAMARLPVPYDEGRDASDCAAAFAAGTVRLKSSEIVSFKSIVFGDDDSPWARDGECDDRRFFGTGMAMELSWDDSGHDATDCLAAFQAGTIALWNPNQARAATQCSSLDFGNDSGPFAHDGECDDIRFEGSGTSPQALSRDLIRKDASDCRAQCDAGRIFLRNY